MISSSASQSSRNERAHNLSRGARPRVVRSTVLHLAADLETGSEAREVVDLAVQGHRAGWRPVVASAGGALVLEAERAAVRHSRMPLNRNHMFARWRSRVQLEALIQRERPSLIHVHGLDMLAHAHGLNLIHRLPLLVDVTEPSVMTPKRRQLLQTVAARQACFRVPSLFMAAFLREEGKLESDLLYHVPPGIDLHWFEAGRVSPERLQKLGELWRLPEQATILVMATPLAPGYGHKQLLEALARLKRDDIFTVFVGDDRLSPGTRGEIEKLVAAHGLEGKVVMPEHCSDWPAAFWLATLVLSTNTHPRGQAMELLAAQAMGRPAIVTGCGANTELVKGGETAWVVPPDDIGLLAQALTEAVQMTEAQRLDLAKRTRDFVATGFPQETWCSSMMSLYGILLGHPAPAAAG
ncbi:MAG: glycosyltransferase [Alphaproteobacteria bacterium]|nr:glycosyltransferase [Alphaproteobacteria bacterium]